MSSDYTIHRTDPNNGQFVIKAYTANGPSTPNNTTPLYPSAVSANTSLVLLGRGMFDYGEPIQTDLVHMLENFANSTSPAYPIQGQLWYNNSTSSLSVYTGTSWQSFLVDGAFSSNLDLNGFKVINLGNPTANGDAVSLGYANTHYLQLSGGTMTGIVTFSSGTITGLPLPTVASDVVNKQYVDDLSALYISKSGSLGNTGTYTWDGSSIPTTLSFINSTLSLVNTNIIGNISLAGDFVVSGAHTIDFGGNTVSNVSDPVNPQDAATRSWVLTQISGIGGGGVADGTLMSGVFNDVTGVLTLTSSVSGDVVIPGFFTANDIPVDFGSDIDQFNSLGVPTDHSWLSQQLHDNYSTYPVITVQEALEQLDVGISEFYRPRKRYISTIVAPGTTFFTLPFYYTVELNSLMVTINGVKQYNSTRGYSTVTFPNTSKMVDILPLTVDTNYTFNISVNAGVAQTITIVNHPTVTLTVSGVPDDFNFIVSGDVTGQLYIGQKFTVTLGAPFDVCNGTYTVASFSFDGSITQIRTIESNQSSTVPPGSGIIPSGPMVLIPLYTYIDLVNQINGTLTGARCVYDTHSIVFISEMQGDTSSTLVTDVDLFSTLSAVSIVNGPNGVYYGYTETGLPYTQSNTITLRAAPVVGAVVEILDTK